MHFLVPAFTAAGVHVACPNYRLAPATSWATSSAIAGAPSPSFMRTATRSAPAPVDCMCWDIRRPDSWPPRWPRPTGRNSIPARPPICWAALSPSVSGFYDIEPFADTGFQRQTKFAIGDYKTWNPVNLIRAGTPPGLLITGAKESGLLHEMMDGYATLLRTNQYETIVRRGPLFRPGAAGRPNVRTASTCWRGCYSRLRQNQSAGGKPHPGPSSKKITAYVGIPDERPSPPTPCRPISTRRCFRSARTSRRIAKSPPRGCRSSACSARRGAGGAAQLARAGRSRLHRRQSSPFAPRTWRASTHRRGPGGFRQRQVRRLRLSCSNASIAAGGVLPMCQDFGTAIIMGKKGRLVWTDGGDETASLRARPRRLPQAQSALFAARTAPCSRRRTPAPTCRRRWRYTEGAGDADLAYKFLFIAKGDGSANKAFLFQADAVDPFARSPARLPEREGADAGTATCPPYHLAIVIGSTSARAAVKTVKLASPANITTRCRTTARKTAMPSATRRWSKRFRK